jgi:hypothetical protein
MDITGIGTAVSGLSEILGKIFPDKTQAEKDAAAYQIAILQAAQQSDQMQADVNKVEAGSQSLFVAGWRPFIGWICGTGLLIATLGPLISYIVALCGHVGIVFPALDTETLMTLLFGLLGLGGMRTYEKVAGVKGVGH